MPCHDFMFSEERPQGPRLPRARFGPVRCAGGPTRTQPWSPRSAAASRRRRGDLGCPNPGRGTAPRRPRFSKPCPPANPHLPSPKAEECRAGLETPRMGCRRGPAGWSPGGPGRAAPGVRPAPRRAVRAPGCVALPGQPRPEPGHPPRGQWRPRGPARLRSQPATPSAFRALLRPRTQRNVCTFHRLLHHLVVAIHGGWGPCPARGCAAASRPSGGSGGWASAGAEPCEFGGGGGRGGAVGAGSHCLPLQPFQFLGLQLLLPQPSPPPFAYLPLASEAPGCC